MKKSDYLLMAALVCVSATLRAPITALGTLIAVIRDDLQMSNAVFGVLTTIPLVMFAIVSPFVGSISKRFGVGYVLLISLLASIVGILIRSYLFVVGLFVGTIILGIAISFGNVLIPGIIKNRLHAQVGLATGLYITSLSAFAGLSAGVSLPLAQIPGMNWQNSLAVWIILLVISLLVWYPYRHIKFNNGSAADLSAPKKRIITSPLAWWLVAFFALQSFIFYFMVAWLPSILRARGISFENAGYYAFGYQLMSIPSAFLVPQIAARKASQRGILAVTSSIYVFGVALLLISRSPISLLFAALICGFSTGASFSMIMLLIPLRAPDAAISARLSGLVQSAGYAFAAIGPPLMGSIFDLSGSWTVPLILILALAISLIIVGYYCGQDKTV